MIDISQNRQMDGYIWQAVYTDETVIGEYDVLEGRGFSEVDVSRVKTLLLLGNGGAHAIAVPDGAEPVFFRRRRATLELFDASDNAWNTTHCIGWRMGKQEVYHFVFEDDSTLVTSDFQAV